MSHPDSDRAAMAFDHKVADRHRERLAVVYVRQSTAGQVRRHPESTQLQYGLVERAAVLGWPRSGVLVIDDDLGLSGASADGRPGFQRLLSEVALDRVGVILGVEMSRLARSCKDWYQLLELCALFGTLICDLDGLYDPSSYNDRLLLGLKGTMSEAELHILRQRMRQGALQKARRGELVSKVPIGYVRTPAGEVGLDPDEQVRSFVGLVFDQFERIGSATGLLRWMVGRELLVPVRADCGPDKGRLQWRRPSSPTLRNMLVHPMYAGAYVYGRTYQARGKPRRGRPQRVPPDQWQVLLRDRYPAYITWERYESNVARLAENRSLREARGSTRRGGALLTGLVVCGRCGARMMTRYAGKASQPRYFCDAARVNYGAPRCQGLAARALDQEVVRLALLALTPSALEVSLRVAADLGGQFELAEGQWRQRLERARFEAERARRQYDAVEPENRLVARTLEAAWEQKLTTHRELCDQHERFHRSQPRVLGREEQEQIRRLAADLPALWGSPSTIDADRKEVLRQVVEEVVVTVEGETEWCEARVRWAGGCETLARLRRPVARLEQLVDSEELRRRVRELKAEGVTAPRIAERLDAEGLRPADGRPFTAAVVRRLLKRYGLGRTRRGAVDLGPGEWLVPELVQRLGVPPGTFYSWVRRGVIPSRRIGEGGSRRLVVTGLGERPDLGSIRRLVRNEEVNDGP
ncbi:MAG TPA: recombinase family protein [Isosphaeraceae bacterium]